MILGRLVVAFVAIGLVVPERRNFRDERIEGGQS